MNESRRVFPDWLICLGLALSVLAAYGSVWHAQFLIFDDNEYVTYNDIIHQGITRAGIIWAFTTFHAANWHPLTWISHMLDCQIYGLNPAGHHATSVMLHAANSVLMFLLLQRLTKTRWPSAVAAGFFALHPLHVESVAWVAERKDVLSAFFWILAVWAYVCYAENLESQISNFKFFLIGTTVLFALALMSKPMAVTLPFVLLLLDYWPLGRFGSQIGRLLLEKIPLFILSAASCVVTCIAQDKGGAVSTLSAVPIWRRLENVPMAYVLYLKKTVWPVDLAALYPRPAHWPLWEPLLAALFLAFVTAVVIWRRRTEPFLIVGWFWFLGMLAPVIGLVSVGTALIADRYNYLSGVGLSLMVIWFLRKWASPARVVSLGAFAGLALGACFVATRIQAQYWHDSISLFTHGLAVTERNPTLENNLGKALLQEGDANDALPHLLRAVEYAPAFPASRFNLGHAYLAKGNVAEALNQFDIQVRLAPLDPIAQFNFGRVLLEHGLAQDALPHLQKAVQLRPEAPDFHYELGEACRQTARPGEAVSQYEKSLELQPGNVQAASSLAWILAASPDPSFRDGPKAVRFARLADQLAHGQDPKIAGILAAALAENHNFPDAIATAQRALQLPGIESNPALADLLRAQLALYRAGKPFREEKN